MWYVYILQSEINARYYIGCTNDLDRRISEHNNGYNKSTQKFRPYKVIYFETYTDQTEAYLREKKIKSYKGGQAFKKLIGSRN